jgi:hypothetical protein
MGVENFAPTGIRSPDRAASSKSLYQLQYSSPLYFCYIKLNVYSCVNFTDREFSLHHLVNMVCKWAARQTCPVYSLRTATDVFLEIQL